MVKAPRRQLFVEGKEIRVRRGLWSADQARESWSENERLPTSIRSNGSVGRSPLTRSELWISAEQAKNGGASCSIKARTREAECSGSPTLSVAQQHLTLLQLRPGWLRRDDESGICNRPSLPAPNRRRDLVSVMLQPVYGPGFAQAIDRSQSASAFLLLRFSAATLAWTVARAEPETSVMVDTRFGNALVVAVGEMSTSSRSRGRGSSRLGWGRRLQCCRSLSKNGMHASWNRGGGWATGVLGICA
jgi:hypothetical protein